MEKIILEIIPYVPAAAWPVLLMVGLYFFINKKRKETKVERDEDSQALHDQILKQQFEIDLLKKESEKKDALLEDLKNNVESLNTNLAVCSTKLEDLVIVLKNFHK
jgi:hypothetical protein